MLNILFMVMRNFKGHRIELLLNMAKRWPSPFFKHRHWLVIHIDPYKTTIIYCATESTKPCVIF